MSGIATAIIGGAIISGVVAKGAADDASDAAKTELEFAQSQYNDWLDVYGPIQENLSEYYAQLSPDAYAAQGIQYLEEESQRAFDIQAQSLAQRGITDSGISVALEREDQFDLAKGRATIRQQAPQSVADQRLNFLSVGQGNSPTNAYQQTLAANTGRTAAEAARANAQFGQSVGSAVNYGIEQLNQPATPTGTSGSAVSSVPNAGTTSSYDTGVYNA